jgi:hypothetical protein
VGGPRPATRPRALCRVHARGPAHHRGRTSTASGRFGHPGAVRSRSLRVQYRPGRQGLRLRHPARRGVILRPAGWQARGSAPASEPASAKSGARRPAVHLRSDEPQRVREGLTARPGSPNGRSRPLAILVHRKYRATRGMSARSLRSRSSQLYSAPSPAGLAYLSTSVVLGWCRWAPAGDDRDCAFLLHA